MEDLLTSLQRNYGLSFVWEKAEWTENQHSSSYREQSNSE